MISKVLEYKQDSIKSGQAESSVISNNSPVILSGFRMRTLHTLMRLHLVLIAIKCYPNPIDWFRSLIYLIRLRRRFLGNYRLKKVAKVNGKYYMGIYIPAWFTKGFEFFVMNELKSYKPIARQSYRFNNVFMAITSKCPLQCDHCYEWERLNQKDNISVAHLRSIINKVHAKGTCQIHFTGGEPLMKTDRIIELLQDAPKEIKYWITTSGYSLDKEKAKALKEAGITGIIVSLDHFDPEAHNDFRNHKEAFYWAQEAVRNTVANNMVAALSLCTTKEFISESNLKKYMDMARDLGVSFVQFIEPKAVGHFKDKPVNLDQQHIKILEEFHLKANFTKTNKTYPVIGYHEQYQRRQGCLSAGKRTIYLDLEGNLHACPFCQKKRGNILEEKFDEQLRILTDRGCETVSC